MKKIISLLYICSRYPYISKNCDAINCSVGRSSQNLLNFTRYFLTSLDFIAYSFDDQDLM